MIGVTMKKEKKDLKIVFLYFRTFKTFIASIACLSAYAKSNGFTNTHVLCVSDNELEEADYEQKFKSRIAEYNPDIVCITTLTNYWGEIKNATNWIKEVSRAKILCGGYHASLFPEEVIAHPSIDGICIGEGEGALVDVLNRLPDDPWDTIDNIWTRGKNGEIIKNQPRPLIKDLDQLPYWDRDIFHESGIDEVGVSITGEFSPNTKTAIVASSRGCYHKCAYCSNHAFRSLYPQKERGAFVREMSVKRTIDELLEIDRRYSPDRFEFVDEVFANKTPWLSEFREEYVKHINKPFSVFVRIGMFKEEGYRLLKEAGCFNIYVGVECGNEQFRKEILNKPIKNEDIISHFKILNDLGIRTTTFNMVGLPFETKENILESIELNRQIKATIPLFFSFQPLPGTELYQKCIENDLIKDVEVKGNYFIRKARLKLDINDADWDECWEKIEILQKEASGNSQMFLG